MQDRQWPGVAGCGSMRRSPAKFWLYVAQRRLVPGAVGSHLMRVNGFAAADSLTSGRRRVSIHPYWALEPFSQDRAPAGVRES
jgi:hypothetical protein